MDYVNENEWYPKEQEIRSGEEAYMRYLGGVALMHTPGSEFARGVHGREVVPETVEDIVSHAERLMYQGLQRLIAFSNPPTTRNLAAAEHRFSTALPVMSNIVDGAYANQRERIDRINPAFFGLKPLAAAHEAMYHNVCHGRLGKIYTTSLMDGILPASDFDKLLDGRTLTGLRVLRNRQR